MADGPDAGLALVGRLGRTSWTATTCSTAARADLLRRLDRREEAAAAYERALALTTNPHERAFLERSSSRRLTAALELPFDALPHGRFRGLLLPGLLGPLAPEPTPAAVEAVHDRGELRLLRLVGLALRAGCWRASARSPRSARSRSRGSRSRRAAAPWTMAVAVAATLAPLAYFKYYGFFAVNVTNGRSRLGIHVGAAADPGDPARRGLVLLVHGGRVRRGHLPGRLRSRRAGSTSTCTCRSSRTWSPGRSCGPNELIPQLDVRRDPRHVDIGGAA